MYMVHAEPFVYAGLRVGIHVISIKETSVRFLKKLAIQLQKQVLPAQNPIPASGLSTDPQLIHLYMGIAGLHHITMTWDTVRVEGEIMGEVFLSVKVF